MNEGITNPGNMSIQYKRQTYVCTAETLSERLAMYGVAIIQNVLSVEECNKIVSGAWDFLEHITQTWPLPINRNDKTSWKEFYKLCPSHSMLLQQYEVGHSQVCWDVRQNPKIVDVFAKLWNCSPDELLTSFDGMSFNIPPEITNRGWARPNHSWYHTDQSYLTPEFSSVQSWVTAYDVNPGDATLTVFEGSHLFHAEFQAHFKVTDKSNWYKLTKEEEQFYLDRGCVKTHIICPKGSMVFWDSRTIHCGTNPCKWRTEENFRIVIYTCYKPRKEEDKKGLIKKQKAFETHRTTTHTPDKVKLFPLVVRFYSEENRPPKTTEVIDPILTELGMKLAGY
jgi:hypothetical protein